LELSSPRFASASAGRGYLDRDCDESDAGLRARVRSRSRGQRDGLRVSCDDVPGRAAGLGDGADDVGGGAMIAVLTFNFIMLVIGICLGFSIIESRLIRIEKKMDARNDK